MTRRTEWYIDDIRANALLQRQHPTIRRGRRETLEFEFDERTETAGSFDPVFHLGGEEGNTLGTSEGGVLGLTPVTTADRFRELRQYIDYIGSHPVVETLGGETYVREYLSEDAPVDSNVVLIRPGDDIVDIPSFWAAILDGDDTSEQPGKMRISLSVVILAEGDEYNDKESALEDLASPIKA